MRFCLMVVIIVFLLTTSACSNRSGTETTMYTFEEESYEYSRNEILVNLASAFSALEGLMSNPIYTPEWEASLKVSMAMITVLCEDMQQLEAPERFRVSHQHYQEAASNYSLAIEFLMSHNPDLAKHHFSEGDRSLAESNRLLQ